MLENQKCSQCDQMLHSQEYLIEEIVKRYTVEPYEQVLFKLVICLDCAHSMKSKISEDSSEKISAFFKARANTDFISNDPNKGQCIINGTAIELEGEYQRVQSYFGSTLISGFQIGSKAIEEINDLLSEETRGFMDDIMENNFGLPPEYKDLFKPILV